MSFGMILMVAFLCWSFYKNIKTQTREELELEAKKTKRAADDEEREYWRQMAFATLKRRNNLAGK
jgi:hypothetical protein